MSAKITIGHPEAHEKLTAKLFWRLSGTTGYNDAGNVKDYVDATTRSLVVRARSEKGARHVGTEQTDVNHEAYTFLLDERIPVQEELLKLAAELSEQTQANVEGATATVESVRQGRWFELGAYNIANVGVTASVSGAVDEGDDYEVDLENGRLLVVIAGGIANGEDLSVTFDEPGVAVVRHKTQQKPLFYCDLVLEEHNQYSKLWLRRLTFKGFMNVIEFPSQTGEFGSYRVKVTPASPVIIEKRTEAELLATHIEEGIAAGSSSSSSSESSQSTRSSSSSSSSTVASVTSSSSSPSSASYSSSSSSTLASSISESSASSASYSSSSSSTMASSHSYSSASSESS